MYSGRQNKVIPILRYQQGIRFSCLSKSVSVGLAVIVWCLLSYFGKFVKYYFLYLFCVSKVPIIYAVICLEVSSVQPVVTVSTVSVWVRLRDCRESEQNQLKTYSQAVISVRITQLQSPVSLSLDTERRHAQADVSQQPTRCDFSGILRLKDLSSPTSQVLR